MNVTLADSLADRPDDLLRALRAIHDDLPPALRVGNQGIATCPLPLAIPDWTRDEPGLLLTPSGNPPVNRPASLRRDFYTGEVFIERESNFTIRPEDLGEFTGLRCVECENFVLDLEGIGIDEQPASRQRFFLHCYGCADFTVRRVQAAAGRNLAMLEDCDRFLVSDVAGRDYEGYGLILLHSRRFRIERCRFTGNLASGIMILGDCRDGLVTDCEVTGSRGYYNWDAGLHICHCSRRIAAAQVPELCHEPLPIRLKTMRPTRIRVQRGRFCGNRAQGIYLEGARECLLLDNTIADNNKEGICCDWGTALCVLKGNAISGNGYRSNMGEGEIKIDFIQDFPLLPDQSSTCKLPGVSFDNGVLNAVISNRIQTNFGGGVKMVRSALANLLAFNYFADNDLGANFFVRKMHDVLLLSMGNRGGEFDHDRNSLLDFYGSSFNRIHNNVFSSDQSEAIHYDHEYNVILDNVFNMRGEEPELTHRPSRRPAIGRLEPEVFGSSAILPPDPIRQTSDCTLYSFGSATDKHHAVIRLRSDGVIEFSPHPNESYWRIDGRQLLFLDQAFNVTTRFEVFAHPSERATFVGHFRNSDILHYLIPLISTQHPAPLSKTLPPLFVNTMPHCEESPLMRLFSGLGWVATGLRCGGPHGGSNLLLTGHSNVQTSLRSNERLFPFNKMASIVRPGQSLTGSLPWKAEYQSAVGRLFCIYASKNLRDILVSHCLSQEQAARSAGRSTWYAIGDPRNRFLAFLDLFASGIRSLLEYAPWIESERASIVRIEDLLEGRLTPTLNEQLTASGIPESQIQSALRDVVEPDGETWQPEESRWERYWSDHAERFFESSGLRALNGELGYEC